MVLRAPRWLLMVLAPPFRILLFSTAVPPPSFSTPCTVWNSASAGVASMRDTQRDADAASTRCCCLLSLPLLILLRIRVGEIHDG